MLARRNSSSWKTKKRLMERYDQFSSSYSQLHAQEQRVKYDLALESVHLDKDGYVADFGCGTALLSTSIGRAVKGVVGLDISRGQLMEARESFQIHPVQGDIDSPPFKDRAFHYVFSFTVLHHADDPLQEMEDLSRYARRGVVCSVLRRTEAERRIHITLRDYPQVDLISGDDSKDIILRLELEET